MHLLGNGRLCIPGMGGYKSCSITVQCSQMGNALIPGGRQITKLKVWFVEVLDIAFHSQVCNINIAISLGTYRKMMWTIFHEYMFRILVTWLCN